MSYLRFSAVFVAMLTFLGLSAQNGIVKGKVTDGETGKPVEFLNVTVEGTSTGTSTNEKGEYRLELAPGKYSLIFSSLEYAQEKVAVSIQAGKTLTVNQSMGQRAFSLSEMTVKSEGKFEKRFEEITVSMEVVKPQLVQSRNAVNVDDVLQQIPGVNIIDGEPQIRSGSGFSFGAGSRVMVVVDDMPLLSGDAGRPSWGLIPIENLEQIEVIKGASSVLYGSSALNGVIHVRTASPGLEPKTRFQAFTGFYDLPGPQNFRPNNPSLTNGFYATHLRKIGNLDLTLGINGLLEDGYGGPPPHEATTPSDSILPGMFDHRIRVHANTRYRFKKVDGLSAGVNALALYGRSANGLLGLNGREGFYRFQGGGITTTLQQAFTIDPYIEYNSKSGWFHSLRSRVFSLDNNNDNNQGNSSEVIYGEYQVRKGFFSEAQQQNPWLRDLSITAGLMANQVYARSQIFAAGPNFGQNSQTNLAAYAQIEQKLFNSRLMLNAGVRIEHFVLDDQQNTEPVFRGGATFKATEYTFVRASFGQGFRFPTIGERFIRTTIGLVGIYPNANLRPEKSWSAEVGVKQGFKIGNFQAFADVAGYWQEYKDFVEFTAGFFGSSAGLIPDDFGFASINTGNARMLGIDMSIMGQGKIGQVGIALLAGYNYSLPYSLTPDVPYAQDSLGSNLSFNSTSSVLLQDKDSSNTILKYRFRHTAKIDLELSYKKFAWGGSVRYNSFMENIDNAFYALDGAGAINVLNYGIRDFRNDRRDGDWVVDTRISFQVTPSSKFSVVISNLFNRVYSLRPMFPEAPRSFVLQYAVSF